MATYGYDANGNRASQTTSGGGSTSQEQLSYDYFDRLVQVVQTPNTGSPAAIKTHQYGYDHRTRRITRSEQAAVGGALAASTVSFSGGTSVLEFAGGSSPAVEYVRGSDWGGGVGGILYTSRATVLSWAHYNGRGDVVSRTSPAGALTYAATYEAYGTRTQEAGASSNADRQRANTKEEDVLTGYLNEGMRYRDLATGMFLTRDPAGFVDGPNVYTYVRQNPWSSFDPDGLQISSFFGFTEYFGVTEYVGRPLIESATKVTEPVIKAGGPWDGAKGMAPKLDPPIAVGPSPQLPPQAQPTDTARKTNEKNATLFRRMKEEVDKNGHPTGLPRLGEGGKDKRSLDVREPDGTPGNTNPDVTPDQHGNVPVGQGMSAHKGPPVTGGNENDPIFEIQEQALPPTLKFAPDAKPGSNHGNITPSKAGMNINDFRKELNGTQKSWKKCAPPETPIQWYRDRNGRWVTNA